jgi:L-ascorbate peroxidase
MSSSIAATSAIGVKANALTRVSKRVTNAKPAVVCSAANKSVDDVSAVGSHTNDAVTRRQALAVGAAVTATLGASTPALAALFDDVAEGALTLGGGDVKEKREINLPPLQIEPVSREEGYKITNGGDKGRAQQQYLKFVEPTILANIDLPYSEYMRLALHDAGTFQVVGKKNGANGSIRFELDRPENKDCKKAFASIEKIKKAVDATVNQPMSYADLIALVPHFAARVDFARDYYEVMGEDDPNFEFLFIGTNPYLGAKMRIGRKDADGPDPEGLVPGADASTEDLVAWFKRMGLGPNQLVMFAPFMYEDPAKGLDLAVQDGTNASVANQYDSQRKLGKRAPGPAVTIIKKLKDMTDICIPGGATYIGGNRDPDYVEYAYIRGGGEIPRVTTFGAFPGSSDLGSSKFAQKVRGDR